MTTIHIFSEDDYPMVNVKGFVGDKQVYSSRVPGIAVPHEGNEVLVDGKWLSVLREKWVDSSEVRLELGNKEQPKHCT